MTEQEQKAFEQMRQALKDIAEESFDKGAVECANHALTAANAVSEQRWYPVEEMSEQIAELSLVIATNSFYQQGHKDGLEWAAQMVEYNDPRTGDWMWDDRNDLANVIRKGPELPDAVSHPQATEPQAPLGHDGKGCNEVLRMAGKAYPRTCKACGLGPCKWKSAANAVQPQCNPALTECPRCKNQIAKCDGVFKQPQAPVETTRQIDMAAEYTAAEQTYKKRIRRASERNDRDLGMYEMGWWDRAWKSAPVVTELAGEILGVPYPDWPEWCVTFNERKAYQQGVADARANPQATEPAGWKLVPVEPTQEMCKAARAVPEPVKPYPTHFHLIWDAMLAAAPEAHHGK